MIKLETSPFLLVQVCFQLVQLTVSSGTGSGSVKIRGGSGTALVPSGSAHTWVGFTQLSSPDSDPCEAEEEHGVPPLHVNLTHVTHPMGKGAQLLFREPQMACKQLKRGCCGKLRRGEESPEITATCEPLPQLLHSLALKICGLRTIKTQYMVGKVIISGSSCANLGVQELQNPCGSIQPTQPCTSAT